MSRKKKQDLKPSYATTPEGKYGYVTIFKDMIDSDAFAELDKDALKVYVILRSMFPGYGPPTVTCAYSILKKHGINEHMASKATLELEALGFITIKGGGYPDIANKYTFTDKWKTIDAKEKKAEFVKKWKTAHKSKTFDTKQ